jgi:prepilin-type N-terminal cleavage/methylation domain-containing protein
MTSRRRDARGFTLVELLVAMVAGLIVAMAIVGISKEATNTFHEEGRVAAAEMQLRTAIDRIRGDLQRTSFMSTGNILADPTVAKAPGRPGNDNIPTSMIALRRLAGLRLDNGGSAAATTLSSTNGLNPDAIDLAGNFTTVEQLVVTSVAASGGACSGQRIMLDVNSSPAMWRLLGMTEAGNAGGSYDNVLRSVFQPVANGQFIVRVADDTGHYQYVATCKDMATASWNTGSPYVDIDPNTPIFTAAQLGTNGGITSGAGRVTINPVQVVRWSIGAPVLDVGDLGKYDLVRQYIDVSNAAIGTPELIAEYAVDLKFAFTVDNSTDITGGAATQTVYAFDDATNATWAADVTNPAGKVQNPGPQRVRAVRVRLAARTAMADRSQPLDAGANYSFRYCAAVNADGGSGTCTAGSTSWARARTLVTEVSLPNQARFFYP